MNASFPILIESANTSSLAVLKKDSKCLFESMIQVIDVLSDESYSVPLATLSKNSLSQHVRHILEFYIEFLNGLQIGSIDYDARKRTHKIETDKSFAVSEMLRIQNEINKLFENKSIFIVCSTHQKDTRLQLPSSLFRELTYCNEHSIHHLALIKIGIKAHFPDIDLPNGFGVAYSTQFSVRQ